MDLVVGGQHLTIAAHQLRAVERGGLTSGHGETTAKNRHLVAARHRDQKAAAALSQGWRQLQSFVLSA